jgi:hypothetical protein
MEPVTPNVKAPDFRYNLRLDFGASIKEKAS